ncbi:MAG TPA: sigma-54 dependent transcriptional regulator [Gemmatimonadaceae bacterium]|jgi:DNA-binding NtrC family response regulator|nr:sigma-54 dependent transcriptional regulator [Gemmatimonadaceae bacterium]
MKEPSRVRILIAEDEEMLGSVLEQFLTGKGHLVTVTRDGRAALDAIRRDEYDVALLDIVMPELDGLEVLRQLSDEPSPPQVIIITGNGTIETAITAIRLGAYDYISKPYRMAEIDVLVRRAWEKKHLADENALLQTRLDRATGAPEIVTRYAPVEAVLALIERVAKSDSPVLITGETGTGKELIARALHRLSERGHGPMIDVDCSAASELAMESELFGHEKGAFPGVLKRKTGLLELANGGTLFLDEVGELDLRVQGKLLRALETGTYSRIGGTHKLDVDVRVVAATKRDLRNDVMDRAFRSDLFFRINTISVTLPPLRDRLIDIPILAQHFLREFGGATPPTLTDDAVAALEGYPWPGNVRELRNVIERAVLLANGGQIGPHDLPLAPGPLPTNGAGSMIPADLDGRQMSLSDLERRHIESVLKRSNWHQGRAAAQLGISSKTLYRKIREYGFVRPR